MIYLVSKSAVTFINIYVAVKKSGLNIKLPNDITMDFGIFWLYSDACFILAKSS